MGPDLRPRPAVELIDLSVQLLRRHARPLFVLAALVAIPQWLLGLAAGSLTATLDPAVAATLPPGEVARATGLLLPILLVGAAWLSVGFGALVASASHAYLEDRALEPVAALRAAARDAWRLFAGNLLGYLWAFLVSMIVFFLAGLVVTVTLGLSGLDSVLLGAVVAVAIGLLLVGVFSAELGRALLITPAVRLEGLGAIAALRRGRRLTSGHVPRMALLVLVMLVLTLVVYAGAYALGAMLLGSEVVANAVGSLLMLPLYPAVACVTTLYYYDLRVRKEGFDLELLEALDAAPPAGAAVSPPPAAGGA